VGPLLKYGSRCAVSLLSGCVELWQRLTMTIALFGRINGGLGSLIRNATETSGSTL
jgi:hypothetical protein